RRAAAVRRGAGGRSGPSPGRRSPSARSRSTGPCWRDAHPHCEHAKPPGRGEGATMLIGVPEETLPGETRVAATPDSVRRLVALGHEVVVQAGAGERASFPDGHYAEAGARIG